jgi:DNA primase
VTVTLCSAVRFDERFLDEIKSRVRLSDMIGRSVKLRRQGREYAGLSPFSKEKSPSFFVNDEKGFWHDFSSGKHGDLISFLQETQRLSFTEAVETLAAEAGVPLPAPDPRAAEESKRRASLEDWLDAAKAWFEAELRRPGGREARDYLVRRGLEEKDWARFGIGYAPGERTRLKDYLIAKGARPGELVETGLLIAPEDGGAPYDRFRDRIMFPIADGRGHIVSFGGRALNSDAKAKYLNGPDTALFDKSRTLYGLNEARRLLHAGGEGAPLLVVEGYMDVIACQRADLPAVASMGTALTEAQMDLLWRQHPEPTLAFDADAAGQRAADRAIDRALPLLRPDRSFRFTKVTGGKDPDDILREKGAAALKAQLSLTIPFVEKLFLRERAAAEPLDTPELRARLKTSLRKLAGVIADHDLSDAYKDDLIKRYEGIWQLEDPARTVSDAARAMSKRRWNARPIPLSRASEEAKLARKRLSDAPRPLSAALAIAVLRQPAWIGERIETIDVQGFGDEKIFGLAQDVVRIGFQTEGLSQDVLLSQLIARGHESTVKHLLADAFKAGAGAPFLDQNLPLEKARALWNRAFDILIHLQSLERAVQGAKQDFSVSERADDLATLMTLKAQRDAFLRTVRTGEAWNERDPLDAATIH